MRDPNFSQLNSERLLIRRFHADDAAGLAGYRSDPEVARYQSWEAPYAVDDAAATIASVEALAPGTPGTWFQFAVCLSEGGALIGDVALRTRRGSPSQCELGFTFDQLYQGQGYATEAARCLVDYAFETLEMHRTFAILDVRNAPAQRLLERLGFRREGESRECSWLKGEWTSEFLYARLRVEHAG